MEINEFLFELECELEEQLDNYPVYYMVPASGPIKDKKRVMAKMGIVFEGHKFVFTNKLGLYVFEKKEVEPVSESYNGDECCTVYKTTYHVGEQVCFLSPYLTPNPRLAASVLIHEIENFVNKNEEN